MKNKKYKYIILFRLFYYLLSGGFPRYKIKSCWTPKAKYNSYAKCNDQPQNIEHVTISNGIEPAQNVSKTMKEHWQLYRRVQHRLQIRRLQPLIRHLCMLSSVRLLTMTLITQSYCPCWECPRAPLSIQIIATNLAWCQWNRRWRPRRYQLSWWTWVVHRRWRPRW